MVTFIPPFMGEEIKSNAERKMYDVLQKLELENAYVLHSLGLPKHQSKVYGEIDFVVVCERGVACLEIKGGRVECKDGKWFFIDRHGVRRKKPEGPFAQVTGNMLSLGQLLQKELSDYLEIKTLLMACGVVFSDIRFDFQGEEIIPEIIFDRSTKDITGYIHQIFDYWENRQSRRKDRLSSYTIRKIVNYLRGDFSFIPNLADRLDSIEKRLVRLTSEQARVMDALSMNERLLIEGGAGTGKTLLAVDFAVKSAAQGKRVLYLTYNKNLSNNIRERLGEKDCLKIINIHALFGEYVTVDLAKMAENAQKYFTDILPDEFYEYICNLEGEERKELQYDLIVMDEGQDIIKPNYLASLNHLLKNGLEQGRWAVFYDEKQNIFNPEYEEGIKILQSCPCTRFRLFVNCRNTVQIGTFGAKASGISMTEFLKENGEEVQRISYKGDADYAKQVKYILKCLKLQHVAMEEVTFLASKKYKNTKLCAAGIEVSELGAEESVEHVPRFATIQGFKGLDAKIVILCEVDDIREENYARYIYIAATRARTLLYIVGTKDFWRKHWEVE